MSDIDPLGKLPPLPPINWDAVPKYIEEPDTTAKKMKFLEEFRKCGILKRACEAVPVSRRTVGRWQEHDAEFNFAMREAMAESVEMLELEARRRAIEGTEVVRPFFYKGEQCGEQVVREYSDSLLVTLLKAHKPEKYRDRVDITTTTIVKAYSGVDVDAV